MNLKKLIPQSLVILSLTLVAATGLAQQKRYPFATDKNGTLADNYELTQKAGPWLILCASFVGEEGEQQARMLCAELTEKHRLKCYLHREDFDFSGSINGKGYDETPVVDQNGINHTQPKKMRALRNSQFEEIAVLVGDFPSVEDARCQQSLEKIKSLQPEALGQIHAGEQSSQRMRVWREITKAVSGNKEIRDKGPMRAAFMIPNPTLPEEYFAAQKVDKFVLDMNRRVKHSLLECPGAYSVRVATFRGSSTFDLGTMRKDDLDEKAMLRSGKAIESSKLMEAANKANELTTELRRLGVDAYEFHDRHESYVCVGSYEWATKKDENGNVIQNPDIVNTINLYRGEIENLPNMPGAVKPKSLPKMRSKSIVFDVQPIPVIAPKANQDNRTALKK